MVVVLATTVWLLPVLLVWWNAHEQRRPLRRPDAGDRPTGPGPLILYADTWPTREVIDLREVQAATVETDHALGPKAVASDLALALDELGVTAEAQRLDDLPADADLLGGRAIVLVYPVRHGQPPAAVLRFVDRHLEPLVADGDPALAQLRISDVAIAEKPAQAQNAQASLATTMAYYGLAYRPGTTLLEPMNSIVIYQRLQALARNVPGAGRSGGAKEP
jgi:hypothetical protein